MAVLEAFVYDPLINWRLMQPDVERRGEGTHTQCHFIDARHTVFAVFSFYFTFNWPTLHLGPLPAPVLVRSHATGFLRVQSRIPGDSGRAADLVRAAAYPTAPIRKLKADENHILNGTFRDLRAIAFERLTRCYAIQRRKKSGTSVHCSCTDAYKISSQVRHSRHVHAVLRSLCSCAALRGCP